MSDLELTKQIQRGLKEWSELNAKANVIRDKLNNSQSNNVVYLSDDEVAIMRAPDNKFDEIYTLMVKAHREP